MADVGLGWAPRPSVSELLAGLGVPTPDTPEMAQPPAKDQLLSGQQGREQFKLWRQAATPQTAADLFPKADQRARQMLDASDMETFMAGVRRQDPTDVVSEQNARYWLHRYADQASDPEAAQFDLAKFEQAAAKGVIDPAAAAAWAKVAGNAGSLTEEEGEALLSSIRHLADATANLGPDLSVGEAGEITKVSPSKAGAQITVTRRPDVADDLPVPTPGAVPGSVLREHLPQGEHRVVSPDGAVVPVSSVDEVKAHRYRGWYPALTGKDGLARWAPARPQAVSSVRSNVAMEAARSGVAEVVFGDHWALDHEDSVVFTIPPKIGKLAGATKLKRAVRIAPQLQRERLSVDTIDPQRFADPDESPMYSHQWAVLPDSDGVRRRLSRDGYVVIDIEGPEPSVLVFGIDPDDAQAVAASTRGGTVLVNEGRILRDGRLDPAQEVSVGADGEYRLKGHAAGFSIDFAPDGELVTERQPSSSTSTPVDRYRVRIPEDRDPAEFAAELEARGATDLAVYARMPAAEGWQNASDELFSDGVETLAVRTAGYRPEAPNSVPVWVRSTDGLPTEPLAFAKQPAAGNLLDYGTFKVRAAYELRSDGGLNLSGPDGKVTTFTWNDGTLTPTVEGEESPVTVRVSGGKATVTLADPDGDLVPALTARDAIRAAGFEAEVEVD